MSRSRNEIIMDETAAYITYLETTTDVLSPVDIEHDLMDKIEVSFAIENTARGKGAHKLKVPDGLNPCQIAQIMLCQHPICNIACAGSNSDYDLLAVYQEDGPNEGIYVTQEAVINNIALQYNMSLSSNGLKDVINRLRDNAPRKTRCKDKDLIAVNNGIFNYVTKELMPFSPDYVFIAKSHVDYNPNAINVIIHNDDDGTDWDVESWMADLSDDPEIVELLWQILGAIIRPHVRWNKSAWLYSNTGNNGKGTLCELMRSLCGEESYASIPLSDFSKDFMLEPLIHATSIIVDENDVGAFIDRAANLKAVITNDVIQLNRKFKNPIAYQFYGFMVQCLNEYPRIKDKSDSFYRRQLFVPFDKCFTGVERKYIKNDYLHRTEVLEYVLYKVLHMNYYTLNEPQSCKDVLAEYKEFNDPVRQFFDEMEPQFTWDLLPFPFLYDLYKAWFKDTSPSGQIQGKHKFIDDLLVVIEDSPNWYCQGRKVTIRPGHKMDVPEPLIAEYGLRPWYNPSYSGNDPNKISQPVLKSMYKGLLRVSGTITNDDKQD